MSKLAIAQALPAFLDREQTLEKAVALIDEAAAADADMVVFAESFIPGYPAWIWRLLGAGGRSGAARAGSTRGLSRSGPLVSGPAGMD
jgi:nitrilase